ncbi:ROK family protein [Oceanobacillus manasiensis]|uniref:ROK family protein n=1 Tax=Oceanobacillus manasiensis TaxID=586413 RepID=UPI0005A5F2F3|nr:ROK family protein [Oceanobacillus manasiensis]
MYLTIDLGGTFVKSAFMTEEGTIEQEQKVKTPESLKDLLQYVVTLQKQANGNLDGIAVSSPGTVFPDGKVGGTSAIPFIHHGNLKMELEQATGLYTTVENDANCAALAEVWQGAAQNVSDAALIIVGTGIGGALVKDRKLHKGSHLLGGEIGYSLLTVNPEERTVGQVSQMASTRAMIRNYAAKTGRHVDSISGEWLFEQAEMGEKTAKEVIHTFYFTLASLVYNIHYLYDPDVILLGGGISAQKSVLAGVKQQLEVIFKQLDDLVHVMPHVEVCQFRNQANLIGALYAHLQSKETAAEI